MKIMRMNDNWNKINTREELITLLQGYEGILTDPIISYLNSLIELEFSVIKDYISDSDRIALSELEVYKRIAMYNIYHRAVNLFKQSGLELEISGNDNGIEGLTVYDPSGERSITLFDFDYKEGPIGFKSKIPNGYRTMQIGNISLFQTIENPEQREAELNRVMDILDRLYDEKNPYHSGPHTYGGPGPQWAFEHSRKIAEYEKRFNELDSKKQLTDSEKREIEITKQFHELLLEDYGLTRKSFEDESNIPFANFNFSREKTELSKTLIKRMPNLTITDNIKYI